MRVHMCAHVCMCVCVRVAFPQSYDDMPFLLRRLKVDKDCVCVVFCSAAWRSGGVAPHMQPSLLPVSGLFCTVVTYNLPGTVSGILMLTHKLVFISDLEDSHHSHSVLEIRRLSFTKIK
jgi:hypothetical protein